jgi:hypothetical protein
MEYENYFQEEVPTCDYTKVVIEAKTKFKNAVNR